MASENSEMPSRVSSWVRTHAPFLVILIAAAFVWSVIFNMAATDFLAGGHRPFRAAWLGTGHLDLFGLTVPYNFEGWADYDFYYVSWADQFIAGYLPYTGHFDVQIINDWVYYQPYFFPPLFLYTCVLGRLLPFQPFGIGMVLTSFGFLTAFPVFGIARHLNSHWLSGPLAASIYLFNPVVLYYTAYLWLNPAPFVFFVTLSFFLFMRNHRTAGLLSMVTAVLFKQIAFFFAIPVVALILIQTATSERVFLRHTVRLPCFRELLTASGAPLLFACLLSLPYILNPVNYLYYILLRPGTVQLSSYSDLPGPTRPITSAVILIVLKAPEVLVQIVDFLQYSYFLLLVGVIPLFWQMLRSNEASHDSVSFWKRLLILAFLIVVWVHISSPRGIYKYYMVALIPFSSILPTWRAPNASAQRPSVSKTVGSVLFSLLILLVDRNVYLLVLFAAVIICLGSLLHQGAKIRRL
jgi:hypothetical protein